MNATNKQYWLIFITLVISAILTSGFLFKTTLQQGVQFANNISLQLGPWQGVDMPVDRQTIEILETDDVLLRTYTWPDKPPIYLYVVFSKGNRRVAHPPEVCLRGSGWETIDKRIIPFLEGTKAVQLIVTNGVNKEMYIYWYKAGKYYTPNYYKQQLNVIINQLLRKRSTSALIRISSGLRGEEIGMSLENLRQFGQLLMPELNANIP